MKKFFIMALLLVAGFAFTSCAGGGLGSMKGESSKDEAWVDDNTYRIAAQGVPKAGLTNKVQRRGTAKEAATIMAQKAVIEKFKGAKLEGASGVKDLESAGIAIAKEFDGVVKGGSVIKSTYDDQDNCEVIYEVKSKGLKKRLDSFEVK